MTAADARLKHSGISGDLEIVFADLEASSALLDVAENDVRRLSPADLTRISTLAHDPARQRLWRAARIATRIVLERTAGASHRAADFVISADGRPLLKSPPPYFNVSHSGPAILVAVSQSSPVGVDIEQMRPLNMSQDRRQRVVAGAVRLTNTPQLSSLSDEDVLTAWVRIEAAAKALGTGIGRLLTEEGLIGGKSQSTAKPPAAGLTIRDVEVGNGYVAAVAAAAFPEKLTVERFPVSANALAEFLQAVPT